MFSTDLSTRGCAVVALRGTLDLAEHLSNPHRNVLRRLAAGGRHHQTARYWGQS